MRVSLGFDPFGFVTDAARPFAQMRGFLRARITERGRGTLPNDRMARDAGIDPHDVDHLHPHLHAKDWRHPRL